MVDQELEAAIDDVGRKSVFERARHHGWHYGDGPPKWVWWGIVAELRAARQAANQSHGQPEK